MVGKPSRLQETHTAGTNGPREATSQSSKNYGDLFWELLRANGLRLANSTRTPTLQNRTDSDRPLQNGILNP